MERHIKPVDVNVVDFPPPVTEGQREWELRLAAALKSHLSEDQSEARAVLAIIKEAVDRRSNGPAAWQRTVQAANILAMFPDDYRMAKRLVSLLLGENDA